MNDSEFREWEHEVFGYGYGTGESHTLPALQEFFSACPSANSGNYDYRVFEEKLGPVSAWLMINILCKADVIEYGTSPRYGWLTKLGQDLRDYLSSHSAEELYEIVNSEDDS